MIIPKFKKEINVFVTPIILMNIMESVIHRFLVAQMKCNKGIRAFVKMVMRIKETVVNKLSIVLLINTLTEPVVNPVKMVELQPVERQLLVHAREIGQELIVVHAL